MEYSGTTGARFGDANWSPCSAQIRSILASISSEPRTWNVGILQHSHRGKTRLRQAGGNFSANEPADGGAPAHNFTEPPGSCGNYDTGLLLHGDRVI
jgi:hypothetical protein